MSKKNGFTLIEVLVVMAIIAILATMVVVMLGYSRDRANDAAIKSALTQLRNVAALIYEDSSSPKNYLDLCHGHKINTSHGSGSYLLQLAQIDNSLDKNGATNINCETQVEIGSDGDAYYCVESNLKSNASHYLCLDSRGLIKTYTSGGGSCSNHSIDCN